VSWSPCTLDTSRGESADCATVKVPYRWDAPDDSTTVDVFVKRYRPKGAEPRGSVWLLQGGPGASGKAMDAVGPYMTSLGAPMVFYTIDQRGTGRSSRLGCPEQEAADSTGGRAITSEEWPACIASMKARWSPGLEGFSVTNTARDLGELISTLRAPNERVFVYGVSYGTYLANRYMQLYPDQASGVILDSIAGVNDTFTHSDLAFDAVVHRYFDECGKDAACSKRLGVDPWKTFGDVLGRLDAGSCSAATQAGLTRPIVRHLFASLAYSWDARILMPALVHRLDRCGDQDAPVFTRLGELLSQPLGEEGLQAFSMPLANHIGLSELWDEPSPAVSALAAEESETLVSNGVGASMGALHDAWPRLPHDRFHGAWAKTATPILMLAGDLDPATPLDEQEPARAAFAGAHQTFVTVPRASHAIVANSPVTTAGAPGCGADLLAQFLREPASTLDASCVDRIAPLSFESAGATTTMVYLGTTDLWGD